MLSLNINHINSNSVYESTEKRKNKVYVSILDSISSHEEKISEAEREHLNSLDQDKMLSKIYCDHNESKMSTYLQNLKDNIENIYKTNKTMKNFKTSDTSSLKSEESNESYQMELEYV